MYLHKLADSRPGASPIGILADVIDDDGSWAQVAYHIDCWTAVSKHPHTFAAKIMDGDRWGTANGVEHDLTCKHCGNIVLAKGTNDESYPADARPDPNCIVTQFMMRREADTAYRLLRMAQRCAEYQVRFNCDITDGMKHALYSIHKSMTEVSLYEADKIMRDQLGANWLRR